MFAALPEHPVEAAAKRLGLNLLGVRGTDCRQPIGKDDPRLEQIQLPVKLHLVQVEILPVEPGQQHVPMPEDALISQVMDGQQRGDVLIAVRVGVFDVQISGDQSRLPIVAVDDIDLQMQETDRFQRRPTEEHEPLAVVLVIFALLSIELGPVVIVVLLDEEDWHIGTWQHAAKQSAANDLVTDWNVELHPQWLDRQTAGLDLPIGGHDDGHVVSGQMQIDRQRAAHIGQPPRFGKRGHFAGCEDDVQGRFSDSANSAQDSTD